MAMHALHGLIVRTVANTATTLNAAPPFLGKVSSIEFLPLEGATSGLRWFNSLGRGQVTLVDGKP